MFNTCCHMIFCSVLVKTSDNYYFLCTLLWFSQCCFLQFSVVAFFKRSLLVLPFMAVSVSVFKASPRPPSLSPPCQSKKKKKKNSLPLLFARPCQYIYLLCLDIFLLLTPRFVLWGPVDGETRHAEWQSQTDSAALKYIYQNPTDARICAFNTQLWKGNYCLLFRFKATSAW